MSETKKRYSTGQRALVVDRIVASQETLIRVLAVSHATEFLEIDITMPQAKTLYLVGAAGEIRMSELSGRLGVSLSTVSGLVERLVEHGLVGRHDDPADRRQVVVSITDAGLAHTDRFAEMKGRQFRGLLDGLSDDDLETVERGIEALVRAAERVPVSHGPLADSVRPRASTPGSSSTRTAPSDERNRP